MKENMTSAAHCESSTIVLRTVMVTVSQVVPHIGNVVLPASDRSLSCNASRTLYTSGHALAMVVCHTLSAITEVCTHTAELIHLYCNH